MECSSNAYLPVRGRLSEQEERALVSCGFTAPDDQDPNFWLAAEQRAQTEKAAFAVVAALTTVFGICAG